MQIATVDGLAEMQVDNRWSKCIVVSMCGKTGTILHPCVCV